MKPSLHQQSLRRGLPPPISAGACVSYPPCRLPSGLSEAEVGAYKSGTWEVEGHHVWLAWEKVPSMQSACADLLCNGQVKRHLSLAGCYRDVEVEEDTSSCQSDAEAHAPKRLGSQRVVVAAGVCLRSPAIRRDGMAVVRSADIQVVQPLTARDIAKSCRASRSCKTEDRDRLILEGDDCGDVYS